MNVVRSPVIEAALQKAYNKQLQKARNGLTGPRSAVFRQKLAQLLIARICNHDVLRAWDYNNYIAIQCEYCKFTFMSKRP